MYKSIVRPLLFSVDPETSHKLARWFLGHDLLARGLYGHFEDKSLEVDLGPVKLKNPVGLSAGFDKDCDMVSGLRNLGFGYTVVGSILEKPRTGNPHPRLIRYREIESLVNSLGFPSKGIDHSLRMLRKTKVGSPVIANIAGFSIDEYVRCFEMIQGLADAVELSLDCPNLNHDNTADFYDLDTLAELLTALNRIKKKPLGVNFGARILKDRENAIDGIDRCRQLKVDYVGVEGGKKVHESRLGTGTGYLTGRAIFDTTLIMTNDIYSHTSGKIPIKAGGGIFSGSDAYLVIAAGATAVGLLTAIIYEGWDVARKICEELSALLRVRGFSSVEELRGTLGDQKNEILSANKSNTTPLRKGP